MDAVAVIRANHRQAGEAAFSCFGLPNNREAASAAEIQEARHGHVSLWAVMSILVHFNKCELSPVCHSEL